MTGWEASAARTGEGTLTVKDALELIAREARVEAVSPLNSHVTLPNGWKVSVGYGYIHACDSRPPFGDPNPMAVIRQRDTRDWALSPNAEVALFAPDGSWFEPHGGYSWGWIPARDLLVLVDAVATYREGGPCPCPDCLDERRAA